MLSHAGIKRIRIIVIIFPVQYHLSKMNEIKTKERYQFSTRSFTLGLIIGILISATLPSFISISTGSTKPKISKNNRPPNMRALQLVSGPEIQKHNKNHYHQNLKKFDCIQISQWYETDRMNLKPIELGNVVLIFNPKNETVIIGNLSGLNYEKQGDTIQFTRAANPLDRVQFRDSFTFNKRTAALTQKMSLLGEDGQYFTAYLAKYRCEKLFTIR